MPIRTCIACRKKDEKYNLLRITGDLHGHTMIDYEQKINARGIYLCKNSNCINKCLNSIEKKKIKLKIDVNYNNLKEILKSVFELGE